jgi:uncharacterized damage-inducible protein DinB
MDFYLSGREEGFMPPSPFTLDEFDPEGRLPSRPYTKGELHAYLVYCRKKLQSKVEELTETGANELVSFPWGEVTFQELMLYNMRHVQHHVAQLQLILRQEVHSAPGWVAIAKA